MPLPLTVSCFSKIQIGSTFLVPANPGSSGQWAVKRVCVCAQAITSGNSGPKDQVALHYYYTSLSHWCTTHEVSKS